MCWRNPAPAIRFTLREVLQKLKQRPGVEGAEVERRGEQGMPRRQGRVAVRLLRGLSWEEPQTEQGAHDRLLEVRWTQASAEMEGPGILVLRRYQWVTWHQQRLRPPGLKSQLPTH